MKRVLAAASLFILLLATGLSAPHAIAAPRAACPAPDPPGAPAPPAMPLLHGLRVGLALGSGSMHGLAHIGVIEALEARGVEVKVVSGTSVGALVGSLWASGLTGHDLEAFAKKTDLQHIGEWSASWQGLLTNDDLRARLEDIFAGRPIESWPRRFGAVATNVETGGRRLLASGDGATAVQASTAMPVYYEPVEREGERLADGALVEPVPVRAARELGADYVIAVDVAYRPYEARASGMVGYGFQAMHILVNSLGAQQMRSADFRIRIDAHRTMVDCGNFALIAAGRNAVREQWPQLERSLAAAASGAQLARR